MDLLIKEGHSVVVIDNLLTGHNRHINPQLKFYSLDIRDTKLEKVVEVESPGVVIHQAALIDVQQSISHPVEDGTINAIGTLNVLRVARLHRVRKFIYASTCAAYGNSNIKKITEDHPINLISFYGASKYMGEIYVRLYRELYQLDYTILRYANVYDLDIKRKRPASTKCISFFSLIS